MKHGKYKLRKVVKEYLGAGVVCKDIQVPYELLECGHSIRYREPKSTAEKIARLGNNRRKCYECGLTNACTPTNGGLAQSESKSTLPAIRG